LPQLIQKGGGYVDIERAGARARLLVEDEQQDGEKDKACSDPCEASRTGGAALKVLDSRRSCHELSLTGNG